VIQDTGIRPEEVFRIRIENIDSSQHLIFNPNGKTKAAHRHVPISERIARSVIYSLFEQTGGLAFPFTQG
jgi:integrase